MARCEFSNLNHATGSCGSSLGVEPCVSLSSCKKDIKSHLKSYDVRDASLQTEKRLILARAGVFDESTEYDSMTICPQHRDSFGIRWRCGRTRCGIPQEFSGHITSRQPPKGNRGVTLPQAKTLFMLTGTLLQIGLPICPLCRQKITKEYSETSCHHKEVSLTCQGLCDSYGIEEIPEKEQVVMNKDFQKEHSSDNETISLVQNEELVAPDKYKLSELYSQKQDTTDLVNHEQSYVEHLSSSICQDDSPHPKDKRDRESMVPDALKHHVMNYRKEKLNDFLKCCGLPPITMVDYDLSNVAERTRRRYLTELCSTFVAVLQTLSPTNPGNLWEVLRSCDKICGALNLQSKQEKNASNGNDKYLKALTETYNNASSRNVKRQILSILADLTTFEEIRTLLPGLTRYMFTEARKHRLVCGRGAPVVPKTNFRKKVDVSKLDQFLNFITSPYIVQDLPFGQRFLKLSSGETIQTPNVIRVSVNEHIINQYEQYCKESDSSPLSRSTLRRILSACKASVRKCLQGLDNFHAEGSKAFDDISELVDKLGDSGSIETTSVQQLQMTLKLGKNYLKTDFKVHVKCSSRVPDHCCQFALSDATTKCFSISCDHEHDLYCEQCEKIKTALSDIKVAIASTNFESQGEKDEVIYTFNQALLAIENWKAHQLRAVVQDTARTDILDILDESKVLLIQDWAMKFLPRRYRESQGDWFAKRGISWHITVAIRKKDSALETQAFVHIIEKCKQDSPCVVILMEHVLETLKKENPEIKSAFYRQDNAGCYHSAYTIYACKNVSDRTGVFIKRIDFSDPQGGKGPCDRFAATMKSHVRAWLNEGHDVSNAQEFQEALLSHGGVPGTRICLLEDLDYPECLNDKWPGISKINNFEFDKDGIKVWRAYQVGKGKEVPFSNNIGDNATCKVNADVKFSNGGFRPVVPRKTKKVPKNEASKLPEGGECVDIADEEAENSCHEEDESSEPKLAKLFACPNEGCVKVYQRYGSMVNHTVFGRCQLKPERESMSLLDTAKFKYSQKLLGGDVDTPITSTKVSVENLLTETTTVLKQGWALKTTKTSKHFSEKQKKFLEEKFMLGETTGKKLDPNTVAKQMRAARGSDGERLFSPEEYLSASQIQGFFSRRAKSMKKGSYEDEDYEAAEVEDSFTCIRDKVLEETELRHPLTYEGYNLCELVAKNKLSKYTVAVLKEMCSNFELDVHGPHTRYKAPYIKALSELTQSCSCSQTKE